MLTYETNGLMRQIACAAVRVEKATGFPAAVTLAMSACESGWWSASTGDWNFFGITRAPENGPAKFCWTHEDITPAQLLGFRLDEQATAAQGVPLSGGSYRYRMQRWFASYENLDAALSHYVRLFIESPSRYKAAWDSYRQTRDADELLRGICEAGYATGSAEGTELTIEHQTNIVSAIAAARAETTTA